MPPSPKPLTLFLLSKKQGAMQRPSLTQRVLALPVIRQGPLRENPEPPSPGPLTLLRLLSKKQGTMQRPSQTQRVLALPVIRQVKFRSDGGAPFPQTPNPFSSLQEARSDATYSLHFERDAALPVIRWPPLRLDGGAPFPQTPNPFKTSFQEAMNNATSTADSESLSASRHPPVFDTAQPLCPLPPNP